MGARERRVSPKQLRISQPSKSIGQMGMTRKGCEKKDVRRIVFRNMAGRGQGRKKEGERYSPLKARGPAHRALGSIPPRSSAPR